MTEEKDLYNGCINGNEAMWKELFDSYFPIMHAICLRYSNSSAEADDIVQEGFVKIFSKLNTFKWQGKGSFIRWMKTIFINSAINAYKKRTKNKVFSIETSEKEIAEEKDTDADSIITLAMDHFSQEEIINAVTELPDQFKVVFNMFAIDGMKHKEISEALDIPVKTSTTRYLRAKGKLKVILEKKLEKVARLPQAQ